MRTSFAVAGSPLLPALAGLAALALAALVARWWWRRAGVGCGDAEGPWAGDPLPLRATGALVVGLATTLAAVTVGASALAAAGVLRPGPLALILAGLSAAFAFATGERGDWRGQPRPAWTRAGTAQTVALTVLVVTGVALRAPPIAAPLAGRDQGTYQLRGEAMAHTGALTLHNPALAAANRGAAAWPGAADIAGLYGDETLAPIADLYAGSYRPGLYLAAPERGELRPQFLHGFPAALAATLLVGLPSGALPLGCAALAMLALWGVARRLWPEPHAPWPALALAIYALSPLAIWAGRTPLSEGPTAALTLAGAFVALSAAHGGRREFLPLAAALLGALAWVRGNAWIALPVVLALALIASDGDGSDDGDHRDPRPARWAIAIYAGLGVSGIALHVVTSYPYVFDELRRMGLGDALPTLARHPMATAALAVFVVGAIVGLDLTLTGPLRPLRRRLQESLAPRLPSLLVAVTSLGLLRYLALAWGAEGPPHARLDPAPALLGWPLLAAALGGLGLWATRRAAPPAHARVAYAWATGVAALPAVTVILYGSRNLPHVGLYYYGRYLVPEILPAAILAAVFGLASLAALPVPVRWPWMGRSLAGVGALALLVFPAHLLVTAPQTRLREFEDAARAVDWLDARIEPGAVLIAGGEGWHHAHTFNHVAGALELGRGHPVLRYHSREAAYATMHALLVEGPAATGTPAPPVYLLVNEATKSRRLPDRSVEAGLDLGLYAPFRARRVDRMEMFVYRLTPSVDAVPTRVTRDVLRMGLARIEVDPDAAAAVTTLTPRALPAATRACLDPGVELGVPLPAGEGPRHLVVQLSAAAADLDGPRIAFDGAPLPTATPIGARPRRRSTHGPWLIGPDAGELTLAARRPSPDSPPRRAAVNEPCPHGSLAELRLLPIRSPAAAAHTIDGEVVRIAPERDYGHPIPPTRWVTARALGHHRPGIDPPPELRGTGLVLGPDAPLRFPATDLPPLPPLPATGEGTPDPWQVVVTLTGSHAGEDASLELWIDGVQVAEFSPPPDRARSWQTPAVEWRREKDEGRSPTVGVELRLRGAEAQHYVLVRDVALFGPR